MGAGEGAGEAVLAAEVVGPVAEDVEAVVAFEDVEGGEPGEGFGDGGEGGEGGVGLGDGGGSAGVGDGAPGGALLDAGVEAHGAYEVAEHFEMGGGPACAVLVGGGEAVGVDGGVGEVAGGVGAVGLAGGVELGVVGGVEVAADGDALEGVLFGSAGGSGAVAPEALAVGGEEEFEEAAGELAVGGAAEEEGGVGGDAGLAGGGAEAHGAGGAAGAVGDVGLEESVEVDADAGGGVACADVEGDLVGGIGEVAGVGADALDEGHAVEPALFDGVLVGAGDGGGELSGGEAGGGDGGFVGVDVAGGESGGLDGLAAADLHDGLEGLGDGAALGGVGEAEGAAPAGIGEVLPGGGLVVDADGGHAVAVEADAEGAEGGAEVGGAPPGLAGEVGGDEDAAVVGGEEAGGELAVGPRGDGDALAGGGFGVVGAAAEPEVHAGGEGLGVVGGAEGLVEGEAGGPVVVGDAVGAAGGVEGAAEDDAFAVGAPGAALSLPPGLEGGDELALDVAGDLGGAADVPPVDEDRLAVARLVPAGEADAEFVADGLVVGGDDDEDGVAVAPLLAVGLAAEPEGEGDDEGDGGDDEPVFHGRRLLCGPAGEPGVAGEEEAAGEVADRDAALHPDAAEGEERGLAGDVGTGVERERGLEPGQDGGLDGHVVVLAPRPGQDARRHAGDLLQALAAGGELAEAELDALLRGARDEAAAEEVVVLRPEAVVRVGGTAGVEGDALLELGIDAVDAGMDAVAGPDADGAVRAEAGLVRVGVREEDVPLLLGEEAELEAAHEG